MKPRSADGYALLTVLVVLILVVGLTSILLTTNIRLLRENRHRMLDLQHRADQLRLAPNEN